jgi:hypothetical protein
MDTIRREIRVSLINFFEKQAPHKFQLNEQDKENIRFLQILEQL